MSVETTSTEAPETPIAAQTEYARRNHALGVASGAISQLGLSFMQPEPVRPQLPTEPPHPLHAPSRPPGGKTPPLPTP